MSCADGLAAEDADIPDGEADALDDAIGELDVADGVAAFELLHAAAPKARAMTAVPIFTVRMAGRAARGPAG